MRLSDIIKVHKALALAATASNPFEAAAAGAAVRRLVKACNLDPTRIPDLSYVAHLDFTNNPLLKELRDEWREAHPVATPEIQHKAHLEPEDLGHIPFNLNGFKKHVHRKKHKRPKGALLTRDEHDEIRRLLNEGWGLTEVAELTGRKASTINSVRAYHVRSGKWARDDNGHFQWADWVDDNAKEPSARTG